MLYMLFLYCVGAVIVAPFIVYLIYNSAEDLEAADIALIALFGSIIYPLTFSISLGYYVTKKISDK